MSVIRGSFAKQVSDGQYGHERAEVSVELDDVEMDEGDALADLLFELRAKVHAELSRSPSEAVRAAVTAPSRKPKSANDEPPGADDLEDLPF